MLTQPLYAIVRRQATYALTAFVCAALALESAIPGAVLPFLDIVPIAMAALFLLLYDATRRSRARHLPWVAVVLKLCFAGVILGAMIALIPWHGRAGLLAAGVIGLGTITLAFWPQK